MSDNMFDIDDFMALFISIIYTDDYEEFDVNDLILCINRCKEEGLYQDMFKSLKLDNDFSSIKNCLKTFVSKNFLKKKDDSSYSILDKVNLSYALKDKLANLQDVIDFVYDVYEPYIDDNENSMERIYKD